jgi:pyruvate/2-oxoglutarate dehydrogenase complex dihydrolipoamide dehydrogenase (E3) component
VTRAAASADGVDVQVQLADGTTKGIRADYLLVAAGRGPVTTGLNADGSAWRSTRASSWSTTFTRRTSRGYRRLET